MFIKKIKHKHYNYNIILTDLRAVMLFKVLINWLDWQMINKNNIYLSVSEFIQLEWQNYINYLKCWKYLIKLTSENANTAVSIEDFISISKRSKLSESINQLLKVLLLLKLKVFSSSDNIDVKILN